MTMRGFIASLIAITLGLLLVLQVAAFRESETRFEHTYQRIQLPSGADPVFQSVSDDIYRLAGTTIGLTDGSDQVVVSIQDTVPSTNISGALETYQGFLQGRFSDSTHAGFAFNASNLTGGRTHAQFFRRYDYFNSYANGTLLFLPHNAHLPLAYAINITVPETRESLDADFSGGGSINYTVHYTDNNGTVSWEGTLSEVDRDTLVVHYPNNNSRTLTFVLGTVGPESAAVSLTMVNATAAVALDITVPPLAPAEPFEYLYPVRLNYTVAPFSKTTYLTRGH